MRSVDKDFVENGAVLRMGKQEPKKIRMVDMWHRLNVGFISKFC